MSDIEAELDKLRRAVSAGQTPALLARIKELETQLEPVISELDPVEKIVIEEPPKKKKKITKKIVKRKLRS